MSGEIGSQPRSCGSSRGQRCNPTVLINIIKSKNEYEWVWRHPQRHRKDEKTRKPTVENVISSQAAHHITPPTLSYSSYDCDMVVVLILGRIKIVRVADVVVCFGLIRYPLSAIRHVGGLERTTGTLGCVVWTKHAAGRLQNAGNVFKELESLIFGIAFERRENNDYCNNWAWMIGNEYEVLCYNPYDLSKVSLKKYSLDSHFQCEQDEHKVSSSVEELTIRNWQNVRPWREVTGCWCQVLARLASMSFESQTCDWNWKWLYL